MVVEEVEKNTWRITAGTSSCYLLSGEEKALLVDSVDNGVGVRENIAALTELPLSLLNTASLSSLLGNNDDFSSFYMNPSDAFIYYGGMKRNGIIKPVFDNTLIDLGGRKVRTLSFPGITPGAVVLLDASSGSLFSGLSITDTTIDLSNPHSDIHAYLMSLRRLSDYIDTYDIIYPAEGNAPLGRETAQRLESLSLSIIRKETAGEERDGKHLYSSRNLSILL